MPVSNMSLRIQALLLSLLLSIISAVAIVPGSTLYASTTNQTWRSPNDTFFLGFVPVRPQTSPPSFIAAIFYSGGAPVVWSAGNGTSVDSGGRFQFHPTGLLCLVNGSGSTVWDSGTSNLGVSCAFLGDDGNLALSNGSSTVWSTFDHPTDTIVPSQNFTANNVLRSGSYSFSLLNTGNLTLTWNSSIVYWNQGLKSTVNASFISPVLTLQSTGILLLDAATVAYSSDYAEGSDILRILKLDSDGNFRIHSTSRGSGTSTATWAAVQDQCKVFGYCGANGICSYIDSNPVCGCPSQNFEMIDPNDSREGCRRKVNLDDCHGSTVMLTLNHTQFLTYPPEDNSVPYFIGTSTCRKNCLVESCFASTLVSDGSGQCYIKRSDFISGYQSPALPSISYVKVCGPAVPNTQPTLGETGKGNEYRVPAWVLVVVILGTLFGLIALEGGLWLCCCKNNRRFGRLSAQLTLLEYASCAPIQFSYKELQRSTKGFKEKLGAGGFGAVYRGILANKTVVAVKQLEGIEQGERQFKMEVATISSTHHLNLVRLIGFCSQGRHRLLVYEFMKNRSLDDFLFVNEQESGKFLNWEYRFNIALGTARGITYLNEECQNCIVHCDIKPENILLDENYTAKVSDFGLAKLINPKDHRHRTPKSVRGTRGYLAPEWLANLPITSKSDVYSYGMVLLEIVSGRRNFEVSEETNRKKFSIWAYEEFEKGNILGILDKRLADQQIDMEQVHRAIQTSFWCIQEHPSQRPTMGKVLQMLEGVTEIENPPALKSVAEATSTFFTGNVSIISTVAGSPPGHYSSSSFTPRTTERATSALLRSDSS